ncbi:hypothetical protein, conserved [Trypanosoma brucei brucei TREU927]|uniref:Leucyl/phenylalanyl-tRNA protein transferase n=2 Tax=Trypanozoon TaxID=39700 RepID=Q38C81_TRYB2|nr:hypothetical protein, conserved [Trypanosoma brucei brucei TREU927]EAN77589.1 hypothetical protein, conserved [Trypanosoma brucei brucei TREU927]
MYQSTSLLFWFSWDEATSLMRHTTQHYRVKSEKVLPEAERVSNEVSEAIKKKDVSVESSLSPSMAGALSMWYPRLRSADEIDSFVSRFLASGGENEMGFSTTFSPQIIDASCQRGVFPLAFDIGGSFVYGPKLHCQRYLTQLQSHVKGFPTGGDDDEGVFMVKRLQVSKKYTRERNLSTRAASYDVFVNRKEDVAPVLSLIHAQHGENWLCHGLRVCLVHMFVNSERYRTKIVFTAIRRHRHDVGTDAKTESSGGSAMCNRAHGDHVEEGDLVAAEVGFVVGDIYTSATGAYCASGAGTLQLAVVGEVMRSVGCKVWDLGMGMDYKVKGLGCVPFPRKRWLALVFERSQEGALSGFIDSKLREEFSRGVSVRQVLK